MAQTVRITAPLRRVWMWAFIAGAYSCLSLLKSSPPFVYVPDIPVGLDAALSFAMALIIAFRVNRAYERWWEARTLWGTLVNASRNLAVKVRELHQPDGGQLHSIRNLIVAFCFGLKDHLRDEVELTKLPGFETDKEKPKHIPSYIVRSLYGVFSRWRRNGTISDQQLWVLDSESRVLLEVCGGCEKIKTTLMSVSWRFFTWQCIAIYLVVLPWGLVDDFGVWTIPISVVAAYVVMASEVIAQYVEEPFGEHEDHLDLDRICQVINLSVSEVLDCDASANGDVMRQ